MQSRRDQVHSYQFFMHRVISGLVARESDPAELPFRRLGGAALGSVMIAVLLLAGFGIYGLVVGGGATSWRTGDRIVMAKESGTRYVYYEERLHPVVNFASARLVLQRPADITAVTAASLLGVPRGRSLGIPGAPDGLPDGKRLLARDWALCSELVADGRGGLVAASVLGVGVTPPGGVGLGVDRAVLVRDTGTEGSGFHMVWRGHRFAIADPDPVLLAMGVDSGVAWPVAPVWLDGLPVGTALAVPRVTDRGVTTVAFGQLRGPAPARTGQVIAGPSGAFYLVGHDALRPITPVQKDIVLADPATAAAYPDGDPRVVPVSTGQLATANVGESPGRAPTNPPERWPDIVPPASAEGGEGAVCASFASGAAGASTVLVGARLPDTGAVATPQRTEEGGLLADRVLVAPGWGALVEAAASPEAPGGSLHLVTDEGIRYAVPSAEVAGMLGYDMGSVVRLPAALLDRLPAGPALDPAAARRPLPPNGLG